METSIYYATHRTTYAHEVYNADYDHSKPVEIEDGLDKLVLISIKHLRYANRHTIERYIALESKPCNTEKALKRLYEASLIEKYVVERENKQIHSIYMLSPSGHRAMNTTPGKKTVSLVKAMKNASLAQTLVAFAQSSHGKRFQISFNRRLHNFTAPGYYKKHLKKGGVLHLVVVPVCYESNIEQIALKLMRFEIQCQRKKKASEQWMMILACTDMQCMCMTYKALASLRELKNNDYLYVVDEETQQSNISEWVYSCYTTPEGKVAYKNMRLDLE